MINPVPTRSWEGCKNILCIRADNIGDVLMSYPAMRALKKSFDCRLTLLTSSMASPAVSFLPEIDHTITVDLPWIKKQSQAEDRNLIPIIDAIRQRNFDAVVIFTVYSQNPLPAAMLAYSAGIPRILAYCRENPYELLTDWVPDPEPYSIIRHQVQRDLDLVRAVGASTDSTALHIAIPDNYMSAAREKLKSTGIDPALPWIICHPGVSEDKRKYPESAWIALGRKLAGEGLPLVFTGTSGEKSLVNRLTSAIGKGAYSLAGECSFGEFAALVSLSSLTLSVNTATIHLAAASGTPVVVLYALTNPQHLPWKTKGKYFVFDVPAESRSRNEVIRFVHAQYDQKSQTPFTPEDVCHAVMQIIADPESCAAFPALIAP